MTDDLKDKKAVPTAIGQPVKLGSKMNSFHQQVAKAASAPPLPTGAGSPTGGGFADMSTTVIFPDCSSSMWEFVDAPYGSHEKGKSRADLCRDAVNTFIDNCFLGSTKIGIASFPELVVVEPTPILVDVKKACEAIRDTGSTPMHEPLDYVLTEWPLSHGIVISDGRPDDENAVLALAKQYKAKNIKLDAVHIGDDAGGEELMKMIAELTGGIYIKFTDVTAFAKNFKFLTPKYRLQLATSKNPIALLGASEVKI